MPTLLANAYLARPSVLWLFDLYWESSFPITFPWTFDVAPFHVSTADCYPGGALGDVLYEARLLEKPELDLQAADSFGGLEVINQVRFRLLGSAIGRWRVPVGTGTGGGFDPSGFDPAGFDTLGAVTNGILLTPLGAYPNLHAWVPAEHRGKLIVGHLVELDAAFRVTALQQNLFRGEVLALADDPASVSLVARAFDLTDFTDAIPATIIDTDWAPYAPASSLGKVVPFGIGVGRRVPCWPVKAQSDESTEEIEQFTADPTTDLLSIPLHGLDTGFGPMAVSTTGTLPAPLVAGVDYWVVAVDDDTIRLAATLGQAMTATTIDITSAGTGTHTITGGLAQNLSPDYNCVVGTGNLGIVRIWEDQAAQGSTANDVPDPPPTYTVLPRTYRPNGRYLTAVRFADQLDGIAITADVLRVYPDVDDLVVAEWKWLTGFTDDIGGFDAVSSPNATQPVTTAALTATHQGFGLGGVALNGSQFLEARGSGAAMALDSFTVELEAIPQAKNTGSQWSLAAASRWSDAGVYAWQILYDEGGQSLEVLVKYADGSTWNPVMAANSSKRGLPLRVTLTRDGATGTMAVYLGRTQVATDTRAAKLLYAGAADRPMRLGGPNYFAGTLGWVRYSSGARSQRYIDNAYYLWRRSPIEFTRELAADARRLIDPTTFDAAASTLDGIEGGMLRADGWMVESNEFRSVLEALVSFRDLAFDVGANSALQVAVATPPATIEGQFGHGDDYANLLELPTRTRASLTEAIGLLTVLFRRPRNQTAGPFSGYMMQLVRTVSSVGKPANLELPFVDHPVTADIIGSFREARTRTRDQLITVACGHEARTITKGDAFRLNVPAMGIVDLDLEALQVQKSAEKVTLLGVPTNASDFVFVPSPQLPADPADRTLAVSDLGTFQTLTATLANARLSLKVTLYNSETLVPVGPGAFAANWGLVVGAATPWDALALDDNGATYSETIIDPASQSVSLSRPTKGFDKIDQIVLRAAVSAGTSFASKYKLRLSVADSQDFIDAIDLTSPEITQAATGVFEPQFYTWPTYPVTGKPWTIDEVIALNAWIIATSVADVLDCSSLTAIVAQKIDIPLPSAFARYWIIGPSSTQPPYPLDTDPHAFDALDLAPQIVDFSGQPSGTIWWIFCGIYDEFGRRIAMVGPAFVTAP